MSDFLRLFAADFKHLMMSIWSELQHKEKKSFWLHLLFSAFEGILVGGILLNEFVFLKSMHGKEFQLSGLFVITIAVYILLIFFNEFIRRTERKRVMLRWVAIVTRLPLFLFLLFPVEPAAYENTAVWQFAFLGLFLIYYLGVVVIHPTINLLLKHNYRDEHMAKLYSWATTIQKLLALVTAFGLGVILDADYYAFRFTYPVMAVAGVLSVYFLSMIPYTPVKKTFKRSFITAVGDSMKRMGNILVKNRPYRDFEIGFMLYGFAFMFTVTVITLYLENELHLSYTSVAFYKNTGNVVLLVMMPIFGGLLGRLDPRKFAQISYSFMFLYIFFVALSEFVPISFHWKQLDIFVMVFIGFIFFGLFQSAMNLQFNIGSAFFAKSSDDAGDYQAVHLSLVGFRGLFAPVVGVVLYRWLGYFPTFMISCGSLLLAIIYMQISYNRFVLKK
ncbi:MAG: MFS transporter [Bacteroidales bacterium]